jgi:hypothetical protein
MRNPFRERVPDLLLGYTAKGGTDVFGQLVDMANFQECEFILVNATAGSTDVINVKGYQSTTSTADSTSNGLTVISTGSFQTTSTANSGDGLIRLAISRPRQRYVTCKVTRSAACAYGGLLAIRSGPSRRITSTNMASTDDLRPAVFYVPQTTGSTST